MRILKAGVIGLGMSGKYIHCDTIAFENNLYTLAAVSDPDEGRRSAAVEKYGCKAYADYMQMVESQPLDFVVNAAPSRLHVPISLDLLSHGCNVVCEKPVAADMAGVNSLFDKAKSTGRAFTVFHDLRYTPHFQQLKSVIDSGTLGRILQISIYSNSYQRKWDWRTLRENNGGNLMNIGTHLIDQAIQFYGKESMPQVLCRLDRANTFGDADNYLKLILHAYGKPLIDIEVSSSCAYPQFRYNVHGIYGGLVGNSNAMKWRYFKPEEAPKHELVRTSLSDANGNPVYCSEELKWYEEFWEDDRNEYDVAPREYYKAFHKAFTEGLPFDVTEDQVKMQLAIIEECFRQNPHMDIENGR